MSEAARPIVAVVPFGARATVEHAGSWGRQIARRLVERFAREDTFEARPVFLVAMAEDGVKTGSGYLVFGSVPDVALAAQYGQGVGASHALAGVYVEDGSARRVSATLVDVATKRSLATFEHEIVAGELARVETSLAAWLAEALAVTPTSDVARPAASTEHAYGDLLDGMDHEVNATLLRAGDPTGSARETSAAFGSFLHALADDPACAAAEERLLVLAAESIEHGDVETAIGALEARIETAPRAWRVHYLLGELRRTSGDLNGAVLAWSHADSLEPLRDADRVALAAMEREAGAPASALARLRRIAASSDVYGAAQEAIGAILAERGDISGAEVAFGRATAAGGPASSSWESHATTAVRLHGAGDHLEAIRHYKEALGTGAPAALRLNLARALLSLDRREDAGGELDRLLALEPQGEAAAHARRLRLGIHQPEVEKMLEGAGQVAVSGPDERLPAALAELEQVIASQPNLWEAHFGAGLIARRLGDAGSAEREFRRVLELWPEQPDALHELGVALLITERTNEAVRNLEAAAAARPDDAGYLADAGFAQLRAGNLSAARERLNRARQLNRGDPITEAYLNELARVETLIGRAGA